MQLLLLSALAACAAATSLRSKPVQSRACNAPVPGVNITSMNCSTAGAALAYTYVAANASLPRGQYQLQASNPTLCLTMNGTVADDGAPAITFGVCDPTLTDPTQLFAKLLDRSIISCFNGLCLDLESGVVAPNERLELFGCNGGGNQLWTLEPGTGYLYSDFGFCVGYC